MIQKMDKDAMQVPFDRSYWVVPGKFLAGCYPGSKDKKESESRLAALVQIGIKHVISLMEPGEYDQLGKPFAPYVDQMEAIAQSLKRSVTFDQLPIKDLSVPTERQMIRILNQIDICMKSDKPVYLHCWGGRGRPGTVVGCYLVRCGLDLANRAIELIRQLRADTSDSSLPSPETEDQVKMVLSWQKGK